MLFVGTEIHFKLGPAQFLFICHQLQCKHGDAWIQTFEQKHWLVSNISTVKNWTSTSLKHNSTETYARLYRVINGLYNTVVAKELYKSQTPPYNFTLFMTWSDFRYIFVVVVVFRSKFHIWLRITDDFPHSFSDPQLQNS